MTDNSRSCKDLAEQAIAAIQANMLIVKHHNDVTKVQDAVQLKAWKERKKAREDQINNWTNRTGEYLRFENDRINLTNETKEWNNCKYWNLTSPGTHNQWCVDDLGSGWEHVSQAGGGCSHGWGKGVCKRSSEKVTQDMAPYYSVRPSAFTEAEPTPTPVPQQTNVPNVTCCSNIVNVVGSQLDDTNIKQLNECKTSVEIPKVGDSPSAPTPYNEPDDEDEDDEDDDNRTLWIILSVIFVLICMSFISSSIGLIAFSGSSNSEPPMFSD